MPGRFKYQYRLRSNADSKPFISDEGALSTSRGAQVAAVMGDGAEGEIDEDGKHEVADSKREVRTEIEGKRCMVKLDG